VPSAPLGPPGGPAGPPIATAPQKSPADPPYDPAAILARVGTEVIQANELMPMMHQYVEKTLAEHAAEFAQLPDAVKQEQLNQLRRHTMQQIVADWVKFKLLLCEVRSKFPAEALAKNEEKIRKEFNDTQIKQLMETYKADSIIDLENKLRDYGSSLEAQRRVFTERYLAVGWLREQVKDAPEPTHETLLTYYREHAADWETPARAQWEELTARFDKFASREEARRAIAQWGNDVFLRGAPFAEVARSRSHGYTSDDGGRHDWTTQGSLRSEAIDRALFTLPEGVLSQIIEDDEGYHIVRVTKREAFRRAPFNEVQGEIKKRITDGSSQKAMEAYIDQLRKRTPIWNRFEEEAKTAANAENGLQR
jgi:parvulin-like peptidyl-prolyl isomerase